MSADLAKILDNGKCVLVFKNQLNSYTAAALYAGAIEEHLQDQWLTDDFTPAAAIKRLADKLLRTGDYAT